MTTLDVLGQTFVRLGSGRLEGAFDETWYQGRTIFGGLVAAVLARASTEAVDDPTRMPRSLTVQYAAPVVHGPVVAKAEVVRAGKHVTQTAARLEQDGRAVALALASFGAPRTHVLDVRPSGAPPVPRFDELVAMPKNVPGAPTFTQHVDLRFAMGSLPFSGAKTPEIGGWCRLRRPAPHLETLCALLDAWPTPALSMLSRPSPAATIDSTVHFLAELPLRSESTEPYEGPYLFHCVSPTIEHGYGEHLGELWTDEGRLVGRVRQMAAVF